MKRKISLSLIFGAVIPLAVVSTAWACGVLATLKLDTKTAKPGQVVRASGENYYGSGPVTIHLNSRAGTVLATTSPDLTSRISAPLTIPANTRPGYYILIATQYKPDGTPVVGTPGRTVVRVRALGKSARRAAVAFSPWSSSTPTGSAGSAVSVAQSGGGSSTPAALPMLLAIGLSLTLLAAGMTLTGRRKRTSAHPQLGL